MTTKRRSIGWVGVAALAVLLGDALFAKPAGQLREPLAVEVCAAAPEAPRRRAVTSASATWTPPEPSADRTTFPAVRPTLGPDGAEIAAGELLVVVEPDHVHDVDTALRLELGAVAVQRLAHAGVLRARLADGVELRAAMRAARALDGVADVTPNAIVRGTDRQRAAAAVGRDVFWNVAAMHLPPHRIASGADGRARFVVALLDSGVAYRAHVHPDGRAFGASPGLADVEIVAPLDAIDGDELPDDENGHGTFLANLLVGAPGLARGAALMPIRVLDADLVGTEAALVEGLARARAEGADVVNLSLVFGADYLPTRLLDAAIAETLAAGIVIVAAAGNDGRAELRYPAAFPGVVAVGASTLASDGALVRAPYSSYGAALDVLAPGGDLHADANRDGWPDGIVAESFDPATPGRFDPWIYAGTSQAAAHATAAALYALAAGGDPSTMPAQLRQSARGGRFTVGAGGGWLDVQAAVTRRVELPRVGVQAYVVLREQGGTRGVSAPLIVLGDTDTAIAGARVHGRFRGSVELATSCVTARDGTCVLEASPLVDGPAIVALEIEAVVLRDGRAVRPTTLTSSVERDDALAAIGGTGFGPSSTTWTIWSIDPSLTTFSGSLTTYSFYGSGEGSALAPTVIAFDESVARALLGAPSEPFVLVPWRPESFLGTGGTGFGPSSTVWSGWSFTWSGWGSSVYTVFGAAEGRMVAE